MSRCLFENKSAKAASYSEKLETDSTMIHKTAQKFGQLKLAMYFRREYKYSKVEHGECTNSNCRYNYDDDDDAYDTLAPFANDVIHATQQVPLNNGYGKPRREVINELKSEDYDCASSYHEKQQNFQLISSDDGLGYISEDQGTFENGYEGDCDEEIETDKSCDNSDACDRGNLEKNNISAIYADAICGDDEYYHGYYYDDNVDGYDY